MQPLNLPCSSSSTSKLPVPFFGLAFVLLFSSASLVSSCTEQERNSLIDFRDGLSWEGNGGLNMSWINGTDCCQWDGITCTNGVVTEVILASKGLEGEISPSLGNLTGLSHLNLSRNSLYGSLPANLVFSSSITILDVSFNHLSGPLLEQQSSIPGLPLQVLNISSNFFTGQFPSTALEVMKNLVNEFSGTISPEFGNCSVLKVLKAGQNNLTGALPHELFNAASLELLSFPNNNLEGILDASNLVKLRNLTILDLGSNGFTGNIPDSIELPLALGNCTRLKYITLRNNSFTGDLSKVNFAQLDLRIADFSTNKFTGTVPESIYACSSLIALRLAFNNFTGQFSPRIANLRSLSFLSITSETIPQDEAIDGFENLQVLTIDACPLFGEVPVWLSKLTKLEILDLSYNHLTGPIPSWTLDLSNNQLTGEIPAALSNLHFLSWFNVSNNQLEGPVPTGGQFNTFTNSSYGGNSKLCGSMLSTHCDSVKVSPASMRRRHKKTIFALALGVFFGGLAILFLLGRLILSMRSTKSANRNKGSNSRDIEATSFNSVSEHLCDVLKGSILVMVPRGKGESNNLTFSDILKATNNFDQQNIIGCGGNGLVYRAELPCGSKLAIKKLNGEMCLMEREFKAEVEALSMAQHENLVPLWGYCIQGSSRLLIYSFMENGSLDDWLHNKDDPNSFLDWPTRLKIAQGAGRGLSYIHNTCKPHIIHRDVKSSNILLDREFNAYVADFGLARLILPYNTHVTTELVGTLGYIPPEYGQAWVATLRGDIYSFGVVLLELLTGKRPVQVLTRSKELVQWVREMRSQGKDIEVLDPALRGRGHDEQMLNVLEVACKCINHNPGMRPTIQEVVSCLNSVDMDLQVHM
ncbi:hypothetical protein HU200_043128 [Digitaria exilis]|uniref:non-specific serine/threonine protein kinase n=1 Tax=Digitaria exilis TaxID=1010633 RepID=A0A835B474_9POAL|nr:hypothetical protein HU200_043128 [Digitaria exilis]